jgi:hypothetical protein
LYALNHAIAFGMIKDGAKDGSPDDWRAIQAKIMAQPASGGRGMTP